MNGTQTADAAGGGEALSLEQINERVAAGDQSLAKSIFFWGGNIRGSDAYNAYLHREIEALIAHMLTESTPLPPCMFITFSCAEFYWRPMLVYLRKHVAAVEGIDPGDLSKPERKKDKFRLLQAYSHIVTLYFEQRALLFIDTVLARVLDILVRYSVMEFQTGRGQIHLHMLVWLKNGEPHRCMHSNAHGEIDAIRAGGEEARRAWFASIARRAAFDQAQQQSPASSSVGAASPPPAPLASRTEVPESIVSGTPDERARAWNGFVLERWMREHNMRGGHPLDDPSQWPYPEGSLDALDVDDEHSPLSQLRAEVANPIQHMRDTINQVKIHRCNHEYCLQTMRRGDFKGLLDCAKGGFGLEAPLMHHRLQGLMAPVGGGANAKQLLRGRAVGFESKPGGQSYYKVALDADQVAILDPTGARTYICNLADARPPPDLDQCTQCDSSGRCRGKWPSEEDETEWVRCDCAPPMGKPAREEPVLIEENGVLKIQLPRKHPRVVQGCVVCTEWWMGNDDLSIICCRNAPEQCTLAELAEVAHYIPGYMCKGGKGSAEYALMFKTMLGEADADTPMKTLVRRLLIRICGNDFPRQQVTYMLAGDKTHGLLRHTNVVFKRMSLSDNRRLANGTDGSAGVTASSLDQYRKRATNFANLTPCEWLQVHGKTDRKQVPLISGSTLFYSEPPSKGYCESMLLLHTVWKGTGPLKDPKTDPVAVFEAWIKEPGDRTDPEKALVEELTRSCPIHIKVDIARFRRGRPQADHIGGGDAYEYEADHEQNAEFLDVMGFRSDEDMAQEIGFVNDNFTTRSDYDQTLHTKLQGPDAQYYSSPAHLEALANAEKWWERGVEKEKQQAATSVMHDLSRNNPALANSRQRAAIVLCLHTLYHKFATPDRRIVRHEELIALCLKALGRRVLMVGRPGAGKTFTSECIVTLTRMVTGKRDGAFLGAPTGVAAFVGGGTTWHSALGIPTGPKFHRSFQGEGPSAEKQEFLKNLIALVGDETSMTGRTLLGWIGHRLKQNVAGGAAASGEELDSGEHLPFWIQCVDWLQLGPVLDASLLNSDFGKANSNAGLALFTHFQEDVVVLSVPMRQNRGELLEFIDCMRRSAPSSEYNMEFVVRRTLGALSQEDRALYELPGQGTMCTFPTWDMAWEHRIRPILTKLNVGYALPSRVEVEGVPVYKVLATNSGRHARAKASTLFEGMPASTYIAVGVLIRITCNLFGPIGQAWGLVNGAVGTVVEVIYPSAEGAADPKCVPTIVAHFNAYRGPAWCEERPKLVMLPPMLRKGSCRCCSRTGPVYRVAEGQTVHAVQGITVGQSHQVKRVAVELGESHVEHHARGSAIVACSRPETADSLAFLSPVSPARLGAIGRDKQSLEIQRIMATYETKQSPDALKLLELGFFEPLLEWAVNFAWSEHQIEAPYLREVHIAAYHRAGGADAALRRSKVFDVNASPSDVDMVDTPARAARVASSSPLTVEPPGLRRKRKQPMTLEQLRSYHSREE